jgi:predicted helicase
MTFTLRPYQVEISDAISNNTRGIVQSPTGTGKTISQIDTIKCEFEVGNNVMVLLPTLKLITQTISVFDRHLREYDFIPVEVSSSGKPRFRKPFGDPKRDRPPIKATNNPQDLSDICEKYPTTSVIFFSTYHSSLSVIDSGVPLGCCLFDEAHNSTQEDFFKKVQKIVKVAERNYFFTATPIYGPQYSSSNASFDGYVEYDGSGMDNVDVYGEMLVKVSYTEMFKEGYLIKPTFDVLYVDAEEEEDMFDVNHHTVQKLIELDSQMEGVNHKMLVCLSGNKCLKNINTNKSLIEYCNSMGYIVLTTSSDDGFKINGVSSNLDAVDEIRRLGAIVDQNMIVFHINQLAEGIDVPALDHVIFDRKTVGPVYALQSIGRVERTDEATNKKSAKVTIIERSTDTTNIRNGIKDLMKYLLASGYPKDIEIGNSKYDGVFKDVIEDIENEEERKARDIAIQFRLNELMNADDYSKFAF